jgi:hypothetical protein
MSCGVSGSWRTGTLDEAEFELLANKTGATRLGFALLLKFFELEARFPRWEDVPRAAAEFMAGQVKVDPELFGEWPLLVEGTYSERAQFPQGSGAVAVAMVRGSPVDVAERRALETVPAAEAAGTARSCRLTGRM